MMTNSHNSRPGLPMTLASSRIYSRPSKLHPIKLGIVLGLFISFFSSSAFADKAPVYTSYLDNIAVGGYDVVSYFQDDSKPIKGKNKFKTQHNGAEWLFASQKNLDAFIETPEKYQPQFGGYCAYAVARGSTVKGDPLHYSISDGNLYLNYNARIKKVWRKDKQAFIEKGNKKWPEVLKEVQQ